MAIQVGDTIPNVSLKRLGPDGMEELTTGDMFAGKKVVLFGVPGAFTPTCSAKHLPGFVANRDALSDKGVDAVYCLSVNDPFVMQAWESQQGSDGKVEMLPDGNAELTRALDLEMDGSGAGLGPRCRRFAIVVDDGKVTETFIEEGGAFEVSSAENVLSRL